MAAAVTVPLTLEEAVQRASDSNLDIAVERLNPQTFDLSLAGLYAVYHPTATSRYGRNDNVRLPTSLLNPGRPEYFHDDVQRRRHAGDFLGAAATLVTSFNNSRLVSSDAFANFNPQFNSTFQFVLRSRCFAISGSTPRDSRSPRRKSAATPRTST